MNAKILEIDLAMKENEELQKLFDSITENEMPVKGYIETAMEFVVDTDRAKTILKNRGVEDPEDTVMRFQHIGKILAELIIERIHKDDDRKPKD